MEYVDTEFDYKNKFDYNDNLSNYYGNIVNFHDENSVNLNYKNTSVENKSVSVCIVIPTYNEAKNIPMLLNMLYAQKQRIDYQRENVVMNVLVVDDNSPDGTADIVKSYQKENSHIYLLSRAEKNGLGAAYIAGMQHAMEFLNPDIIFEMDGDLSHGPEYVLPMIRKINEGADFVIGSRYVKGGSIPENWGIKRVMISRMANLYAKTVLRIKNVNDCTGGFRAIRTSALKQIDLNSLKTKGYAFQISLLEEMRRNNAIMSEVPIAFKDRTNGMSKMRTQDILEEGLFVLRASMQNIFSPKRIPIRTQNKESWLANNMGNYPIAENQFAFNEMSGLRKDQSEFKQAFGLEDSYEMEAQIRE